MTSKQNNTETVYDSDNQKSNKNTRYIHMATRSKESTPEYAKCMTLHGTKCFLSTANLLKWSSTGPNHMPIQKYAPPKKTYNCLMQIILLQRYETRH